jgi:hypothetical protein
MSRYQKPKELGDAHESPVSSRSCFHSPSRSLRRDCRRTARGCGEFLCATGVHDALKSAAPAVGAEPESTMQDDSAAMSFALSRVWFQQGALPDSVRRGVRKLQLALFDSSAAARVWRRVQTRHSPAGDVVAEKIWSATITVRFAAALHTPGVMRAIARAVALSATDRLESARALRISRIAITAPCAVIALAGAIANIHVCHF